MINREETTIMEEETMKKKNNVGFVIGFVLAMLIFLLANNINEIDIFKMGYQGTGIAESEFNISNYADEIVDDLKALCESQNHKLGEGKLEIELGYDYEYNEKSENPYIETLHVKMTGEEDEVYHQHFIYYKVTTEGLIIEYAF